MGIFRSKECHSIIFNMCLLDTLYSGSTFAILPHYSLQLAASNSHFYQPTCNVLYKPWCRSRKKQRNSVRKKPPVLTFPDYWYRQRNRVYYDTVWNNSILDNNCEKDVPIPRGRKWRYDRVLQAIFSTTNWNYLPNFTQINTQCLKRFCGFFFV